MDNFTLALNYNTVFVALGKADSYAQSVFDRCPREYDEKIYAELCSVSAEEMADARDIARRAFDAMPRDVKILSPADYSWPVGVKDVPFLYMRGDTGLLSRPGVSIVGTRHPSDRGVRLAREAAGVVGNYGYNIVSGLATGIDGVAHIQALADEKPTIAVIGTPIDCVYPPEHEKLQNMIAERGLVVSRFSPCVRTQKYYFMVRNLLMSQLSIASIVVESTDGGGGVSQAKYCEKQGKKVIIFREVYEDRSRMWPRTFKDPAVVAGAEDIPRALKGSSGQLKKAEKAARENLQPSLFDF